MGVSVMGAMMIGARASDRYPADKEGATRAVQ